MAKQPPPQLDLTQFKTLAEAVDRVDPGDRYTNVGAAHLREGMGLTPVVLFFFAMLARAQGLHQAIAREIEEENPHAAFPLLRAFTESVVLLMYVIDHPEYIPLVMDHPKDLPKEGPRRKSIQKLIAHASKQASGMSYVYAELSEATHFGSLAMWASMRLEDDDQTPESLGTFSWASHPRWKSEEQGLIACAMTLELADAMVTLLSNFALRHFRQPPSAAES